MQSELVRNPIPHLRLTREFLLDQISYAEWHGRVGSRPGLLPPVGAEPSLQLDMEPADVMWLRRLTAIGELGQPLLVGDGGRDVSPLDTTRLGVGRHRVFAALERTREPCGDVVECLPADGARRAVSGHAHLKPRVSLVVGDDRFQHRDWLEIAHVERARDRGAMRTFLDGSFHPAIRDMSAYTKPNPLVTLARLGLDACGDIESEIARVVLRSELVVLQNVATHGCPQLAVIQAQRCLALLSELGGAAVPVHAGAERVRYAPDTVCRFLSTVAGDLADGGDGPVYPDIIRVDETSYQRLDGELEEDGRYWTWQARRPGGLWANGLVIYLPRSSPDALPIVQFGQHKAEPHSFRRARTSHANGRPGATLRLDPITERLGAIYLVTDAAQHELELRAQLGDGHAIYYF